MRNCIAALPCEPLWYRIASYWAKISYQLQILLFLSPAWCRGQHSSSLWDLQLMGSQVALGRDAALNSDFTENCLKENTDLMSEW